MLPPIFCSLCAKKFWCGRAFLEMTYICKLDEDQIKKKGLLPELEWFLIPSLSEDKKDLQLELEWFTKN